MATDYDEAVAEEISGDVFVISIVDDEENEVKSIVSSIEAEYDDYDCKMRSFCDDHDIFMTETFWRKQ